MEMVIPSASTLKAVHRDDVKRVLTLAGFRPVRRGEVPEHGDVVINCNRLYHVNHASASTYQSGTIDRPNEASSPKYTVDYKDIDYYYTYSKSWFERVMWIRKKEVIKKPTEQKMETDDARDDYMIGDVIYKNTTKIAMEQVLQAMSNKHPGERVVCYKLVPVAVAYKPIEPKQVQWL